ncbi:ribonuclease R [Oleiagrimonas soli]|uniref:Ribonuclease R n=1 Tax=Oleiagrimonas soli TaxID=1543381 RepID=A0A841KL85_9GAMM|nr:ribonuclease R [Oleiagrimonas soli]MBB6182744.1 ribonuclease R [Oleiagrimonas soli]
MTNKKTRPGKGSGKQAGAAPGSAPQGGAPSDPWAEREAQRYARPIPSREAILALLEARGELMREEAIAEALDLTDEVDQQALDKRLGAMVRDGQLLRTRRDGYGVARKLDLLAGEVLANADGYGFLRPDDGSPDLYLSPFEMRKVLHGDRVLASIVSVDRRGRRKGAIAEVLERRFSRIVGRVVTERGITVVVPDDDRVHQDVLIPPDRCNGARAGQVVIAEITEPPNSKRGPIGAIVSVLGERLKPSLLVEVAIAQHDLPHEWPQPVIGEVENMPVEVRDSDLAGRTDLRGLPLVTIDGDDSKDFDDAVYAQPKRGGGWRLLVAIADVAHYTRPGTALDGEAYERSTSTYFPGFVVPMLPEALSNGLCSLNPDVDRLCLVCDMSVSARGEVTRSRFYEGVMRSHARLTYDEVWQAVGEQHAATRKRLSAHLPVLEDLHALYKALDGQRRRRGAIEFDTHEAKFRLDAKGEVNQVEVTPRNDAHKLIEECMIAANVQAAKFLESKKIPALFRVHASPPADKYEDLQEFLRQYKLPLPPLEKLHPGDYDKLLKKVRDNAEFELIQSVLLRSMSLAVYLPQNHGHFGLSLDAYAHFTSPIRRYPDLLVHRAIRYALRKGKPKHYTYSEEQMAKMAAHCSQRERRAEEAERAVDERLKCAWMEKHVGDAFDGRVTGVTSFGLFVELDGHGVSGLVHVSQLPNDYYHFDVERRLMKGERSGRIFRLGDRVRVQVLRASMEDRKIDFRLLDDGAGSGERDGGERKRGGPAKSHHADVHPSRASKNAKAKPKAKSKTKSTSKAKADSKKRPASKRAAGKRGSRKT